LDGKKGVLPSPGAREQRTERYKEKGKDGFETWEGELRTMASTKKHTEAASGGCTLRGEGEQLAGRDRFPPGWQEEQGSEAKG